MVPIVVLLALPTLAPPVVMTAALVAGVSMRAQPAPAMKAMKAMKKLPRSASRVPAMKGMKAMKKVSENSWIVACRKAREFVVRIGFPLKGKSCGGAIRRKSSLPDARPTPLYFVAKILQQKGDVALAVKAKNVLAVTVKSDSEKFEAASEKQARRSDVMLEEWIRYNRAGRPAGWWKDDPPPLDQLLEGHDVDLASEWKVACDRARAANPGMKVIKIGTEQYLQACIFLRAP